MRVGFVGAGNMPGAMIRGLAAGGWKGADLVVYDIDAAKLMSLFEDCGICMATSPEDVAEQVELLVLGVKPQVLPGLLPEIAPAVRRHEPLVVSIAAGVTLEELGDGLGHDVPLVRAMPNLAAKVGESMTALCAGPTVTEGQKASVRRLFETVGDSLELPESQFSAFTALAGCAPAFHLLYIDALAAAAVRRGMTKEAALRVAAQALLGTTRMLQEAGEHPRALMDQVCSPAGATIEGVAALVDNGFEAAVQAAVRAAADRTDALSGRSRA